MSTFPPWGSDALPKSLSDKKCMLNPTPGPNIDRCNIIPCFEN